MKELIYGKHIIKEALIADQISEIYITKEDEDITTMARHKRVSFKIISKQEMNDMFPDENHQGYAGMLNKFNYKDLKMMIKDAYKKNDYPLFMILDKITDPHNLGAIIRNAAAFNIEGIIIGKHNQVSVNATVHKVSAGSAFKTDICEVTNINQAIETLKKEGFWIVGTSLEAEKNLSELDKETPFGFILGSEGKGISTLTQKLCDMNVIIPISDKTDSLNVSVASGIVMYELKSKK